jgi:glycosyltransferase involved in cell wall biosynthesis
MSPSIITAERQEDAGARPGPMAEKLTVLAVTNLYPTKKRPAWGVFIEQQVKGLRQIGLDVNVSYVNRVDDGVRAYFRMMHPLRSAVREFKPQVLHVMYGGIMAAMVARREWGIPVVVTFHGSDLLGENLSGWFRKWISQYGVYCSWCAARRADGVIVVSERLERALPSAIPRSKVRVISCGIDLERFGPLNKTVCRRQLGWSEGTFHVLFPSHRRNSVKRPWLAAAAVEILKGRGVQAELHYLDGIPNARVPIWLNASDVLLLTSAHEGSPTVVKEALACDVPVVSVDVGDVADRIAGIKGCSLAEPTPEHLADKLSLVQRTGCRIQARGRMRELSLESTANTLARYYAEIVRSFQGHTENVHL